MWIWMLWMWDARVRVRGPCRPGAGGRAPCPGPARPHEESVWLGGWWSGGSGGYSVARASLLWRCGATFRFTCCAFIATLARRAASVRAVAAAAAHTTAPKAEPTARNPMKRPIDPKAKGCGNRECGGPIATRRQRFLYLQQMLCTADAAKLRWAPSAVRCRAERAPHACA